ncbi:hypothetical protein SLS62_000930 [Diatrype stigma]|uniref:Uncharacterized protein n=1 Tax=Diatrype stigma TaxID=117547 RepID=A0AAN9V9B1_9PEZI
MGPGVSVNGRKAKARYVRVAKAGSVKDWNRIAAKLPSRSNKDCRKRWVNTLSGSLKKGTWDEDEDERLIAAVHLHGQKWTLVANESCPITLIPGTVAAECAKRWQHNLDPKLDHRGWTEAEDELLLESVKKYGREWKLIQELSYNTRSRNNLKNRYSILTRRRDSLSTQGAARRQANSPLASPGSRGDYTPGKGSDSDGDYGMASGGAPVQGLEAGDYAQDPAYIWGSGTIDDNWFNSTHIGPDPTLDAMSPDSASAAAFSSICDPGMGDVENTELLYDSGGIASATAQQSPWEDMETNEVALYRDFLDLHTPPGTDINTSITRQNQGSVITGPNETFGETPKRRVSLVVDECDWTTLSYLLDVTKPLQGKVKLEVSL